MSSFTNEASTHQSSETTANQARRIGPVLRRLRQNVESSEPKVDWRAPRFASVVDEPTLRRRDLIDLRD